MFSYEQRYKTFINKKWPLTGYQSNPHLLAICGYICKSTAKDLAAMCVYCKKHLEGWEKSDIPILEHWSHKKDCVLFTPSKMSENGASTFIRYDLKENVPFIFCYKCGSIDLSHKCPVKKRYTINFYKTSEFFFINLLKGQYKEAIDLYVNFNLFLPTNYKNIFNYIFDSCKINNNLQTTRQLITEFIEKEVKQIEEKIDKDINEFI